MRTAVSAAAPQLAAAGHASIAEYVKAVTNGTVAKAFNLNHGDLYERAAAASRPPSNIWVGDLGGLVFYQFALPKEF